MDGWMLPCVDEGQDLEESRWDGGWVGEGFCISHRPSQLGVNRAGGV